MRTTKATHAVERLKTRSGNPQFAAVAMAGGLFYLVDRSGGTAEKRSEPLPLDEFVKFVDQFGPKNRARRASSTSRSKRRSRRARGKGLLQAV